MWLPQMKPGPPHAIEVDPNGALSAGLASLLLFENCANLGFKDYANPAQSFSVGGTAADYTQSATPFGGSALNTLDGAPNDYVQYNVVLAAASKFTAAMFCKWDSGNHTGSHNAPFGGSSPFMIFDSGPSGTFYFSNNSAAKFGPNMDVQTGWHWNHFTYDGTTFTGYLDGVASGGTATNAGQTCAQSFTTSGWALPMSAFFYWPGMAFTAGQVKQHALDPYGTTMRPKVPVSRVVTTSFFADPLGAQPAQRVEMIGY